MKAIIKKKDGRLCIPTVFDRDGVILRPVVQGSLAQYNEEWEGTCSEPKPLGRSDKKGKPIFIATFYPSERVERVEFHESTHKFVITSGYRKEELPTKAEFLGFVAGSGETKESGYVRARFSYLNVYSCEKNIYKRDEIQSLFGAEVLAPYQQFCSDLRSKVRAG